MAGKIYVGQNKLIGHFIFISKFVLKIIITGTKQNYLFINTINIA